MLCSKIRNRRTVFCARKCVAGCLRDVRQASGNHFLPEE